MSTSPVTELRPGAVLTGRYRLERLLGAGGMAAVWAAKDQRLDRQVAIKVISDVLAGAPAYLARFEREARVAAGLGHRNLVKVFDYRADPRPFLVMEYVAGGSLAERRDRSRPLPPVADLSRDLLSALAHVHEAGIVHRDVKPANVLVADDGRVLLTDFGIAQPEDATSLTATGQVVGTLRYLAPEVAAGRRATPRSDLYSLGVLLRDHAAEPDPAVDTLVARMTQVDPARRPACGEEALALLERLTIGSAPSSSSMRSSAGSAIWGRAAAISGSERRLAQPECTTGRRTSSQLATGVYVLSGRYVPKYQVLPSGSVAA